MRRLRATSQVTFEDGVTIQRVEKITKKWKQQQKTTNIATTTTIHDQQTYRNFSTAGKIRSEKDAEDGNVDNKVMKVREISRLANSLWKFLYA